MYTMITSIYGPGLKFYVMMYLLPRACPGRGPGLLGWVTAIIAHIYTLARGNFMSD